MKKLLATLISAALMSVALVGPASANGSIHAEELNNGLFRFGPGGESSVTANGLLKQPFYKSAVDNQWYQLTYTSDSDAYPLDQAYGYGSGGGEWTGNTSIVQIQDDFASPDGTIVAASSPTIDSSGLTNGIGTLVITTSYDLGSGKTVTVSHAVTLNAGKNFVRVETSIQNTSGATLENFYFWTGTRDDYVGTDDEPDKARGGLLNGAFTEISDPTEIAAIVKSSSAAESAIFYSTTVGARAAMHEDLDFLVLAKEDPDLVVDANFQDTDDSYGISVPFGDLANSQTVTATWYYAGGANTAVDALFLEIAEDSGQTVVQAIQTNAYNGPLVTSVVAPQLLTSGLQRLSLRGLRMNYVYAATLGGSPLTIVGSSRGELSLETRGLPVGTHELKLFSPFGTYLYSQLITVVEGTSVTVSDKKVNAGSFKGFVALYAKGYEGQRFSAKVGDDWVIVESLASNYERIIEYTGAGVDCTVRLFIDKALVETVYLTTK